MLEKFEQFKIENRNAICGGSGNLSDGYGPIQPNGN